MSQRKPAVFVSSTCYDLSEVRAQLRTFIEGYGFEPVLSEYSSFPVDPDSPTLESCRQAVREKADLFILILGERFGFEAVPGKSITNLEYLEARAKGIPVYAFAMTKLIDALPIWKKNPEADLSSHVDDPRVFEFIDELRSSGNTWVFPFAGADGILETLKEQWGYLLGDSLRLRTRFRQTDMSQELKTVSGPMLRLIVEKPPTWNLSFLAEGWKNEIAAAEQLERDLRYGIATGQPRELNFPETCFWFRDLIERLLRSASNLVRLAENVLRTPAGKASKQEDASELLYFTRRVGSIYREFLQVGQDCISTETDPDLTSLKPIIVEKSQGLARALRDYSENLLTKATEYAADPSPDDATIELGVLHFDFGGLSDLGAKVEEIAEQRGLTL